LHVVRGGFDETLGRDHVALAVLVRLAVDGGDARETEDDAEAIVDLHDGERVRAVDHA
jgi:hypothetical protein